MNTRPLIAILTDFGEQDVFVGVMKGVIAGYSPEITTIDLSHSVPPGDVGRAAVMIWQAYRYFPAGTVFLSVVDPGVGTRRKPIALTSGGYTFVGPDNGLFSYVATPGARAWELSNPAVLPPPRSNTFHGRDLFAPAAALLALGAPASNLGGPVEQPIRLPLPHLKLSSNERLEGEVLFADRFGNLLTSLGCLKLSASGSLLFENWLSEQQPIPLPEGRWHVRLADGRAHPLVRTFVEIPSGQVGALIGSSGLIEIACNNSSARETLGYTGGERVILEHQGEH